MKNTANAPGSQLCSFVIFFIDNFGYALALPLFPVLLINPTYQFLDAGISEAIRGLYISGILAAFPLAQFFAAPLFGELADQLGRRFALTLTVVGTLVGYILSAISLSFHSYSLLLISRIITGFFAGNMAICLAILSDISFSKVERAKNFSLAAGILATSWTSAYLFGSYLMEGYRFLTLPAQSTFYITAILNIFALMIVRLFYQETALELPCKSNLSFKKAAVHFFQAHKESNLFVHYSVLFFWFLPTITALLWVPQILMKKFLAVPQEITYLFMIFGGLWFIASLIINRLLVGSLTLWHLSLWALFANALFFFYTAAGDYFYYCIFSFSICALCGGILWGNLFSFISLEGKEGQQGRIMGCAQSCLSLAEVIGPPLGGLIAGVSLELILYLCALSTLLAYLILLTNLYRRKNKRILEE